MKRPRLVLESLEGRDVPATYSWLGGYGGNDSGYAINWTQGSTSTSPRSTTLPTASDDVVFSGTMSNVSCNDFGDPGWGSVTLNGYNSVKLINGYTGLVTTGRDLTHHEFVLDAAATGEFNATFKHAVDDKFTWTKGRLGGNGSTFTIKGTTATITPSTGANGELETGMGLSFEGSVVGTIEGGKLKFLSGNTITLSDTSTVTIKNVEITSPNASPPGPITLLADKNPTLKAEGVTSAAGLRIESGKAYIQGGGTSTFSGRIPQAFASSIKMSNGALIIENGTTLDAGLTGTSKNEVWITGGRLATKAKAGLQNPVATIKAGLLLLQATSTPIQIKISDDTENPAGVTSHQYATLKATGIVEWYGGTYSPVCDPAAGSTTSDRWLAVDSFNVYNPGGANTAKIDPQAGVQGRGYEVLESDFRIVGNPPPAAGNWGWIAGTQGSVIPPANPVVIVKVWKV